MLLALALAGQAAAQSSISLVGEHAFTGSGDDISYTDPGFDDSGWDKVLVPASLRMAGVPPNRDIIWYRIKFDVPPDWHDSPPAIRFGVVTRAEETYLNGVKIGGEGLVGPARSVWHNFPPVLPRLYTFDMELLKTGQTNLLAVRIARKPYVDEGGNIAGPVALVDYAGELAAYNSQR